MRSSRRARRAHRITGLLIFAWLLLASASAVLAADPSPSGGGNGDPRSSGQGPGLVGDPLLAIVIVAGIGGVSVAVTLAYVRATGGSRTRRP